MKISKLFHWLYALLMLLPFAFFVPSVLYYAFNDNATMQTVEVPKTETISVDFNELIDYESLGTSTLNGITFTNNNDGSVTLDGTSFAGTYYNLTSLQHNRIGHKFFIGFKNLNNAVNGLIFREPYTFASSATTSIYTNSVENYYFTIFVDNGVVLDNLRVYPCWFDLTQMFGAGNEPTLEEFNGYFPNVHYPYTESELMQITYDTGETEQLVENTSIINYAWESIWDLPLFSWCKVSFVATPFTYITGLFGLAASNSFNYVFTYFASMSIIWLVFDVIMYVPLLVHRWLDKGIVE